MKETIIASNETPDKAASNIRVMSFTGAEDGTVPTLIAANAQDGWMKLLPYGEYPHDIGLQVMNKESGSLMANAIKGMAAKVKRAFSWFSNADASLPIYLGHPDDDYFANQGHVDKTPYGNVHDLDAREDGLWANVTWSDRAKQLLQAGKKLFFSPRWALRPAGNGRFNPSELISLGLTPFPNIRAAAAANSQTQNASNMNPLLKALLAKLGLTNEQATTAANAEASAVETSEPMKKLTGFIEEAGKVAGLQSQLTTANEAKTKADGDRDAANGAKTKAEGDLTAANARLTNVSNAASGHLITFAIEHGRIAKADEQKWKDKFAKDFVATSNELAGIKPNTVVKTESETRELGQQRTAAAANAGAEFRAEVERVITASNGRKDYVTAWNEVKNNPKFRAHLELMEGKEPSTAK